MFNNHIFSKILSTIKFGKIIKYSPKLESTNTLAWELIANNTPNGTVVITDVQLKGRGRQSNKWISVPNKSLTFSIVIYPNALPSQINLYSLFTGLAITDCLIDFDIQAQLKWPNDILIKGKKVGGILCESKFSGGLIQSLVIGIGLNVNVNIDDFPDYLQSNSTSLLIENGMQFQLEILLANILNQIENRINNIKNIEKHLRDWENCCGHLNKSIHFHNGQETVEGIFRGLSIRGQAIIEIDGNNNYFDSGEII